LRTDIISLNRLRLPITDLPVKSRLPGREQKSTPACWKRKILSAHCQVECTFWVYLRGRMFHPWLRRAFQKNGWETLMILLRRPSSCRNISSEDADAEKMFAGSLPSVY